MKKLARPNRFHHAAFFYPVAMALGGILGCSPQQEATYPVDGLVRFPDGEPVQLGTVEFRRVIAANPEAPRWIARGTIDREGHFTLSTFQPGDGALAGNHEVIVQQLIITEDRSFGDHNHGRRVSPHYGDYASSGLKARIEADPSRTPQKIVIELLTDQADLQKVE
ncbi:MAG: hypothetical protein ACK5ZC_17240 [Pirellulaceae bacterium]